MNWKLMTAALVLGFGGLASAVPVEVASLSTVLTDVAQNVGGDRVRVTPIVKAGIDPHVFEPTPGDVKKISNARLVLVSGLGFEGYLQKLQSSVGSGPRFLIAGDVVKPLMAEETCEGHDHDHHHHHAHSADGKVADPHWWHSVKNVEAVTRQIRDALIALDPEGRSTYEANAKAFEARLKELARDVRLEVARLPKSSRVLVTSHDALGYFAKDHGFEVLPVQGISTSDQPSSQKVRDLIQTIRERGVKAIFAENIENPRVLEQITKETGAKLGGVLYADGLGTGETGTYEGMMRHNAGTIVAGLQ
ncbi:MAG: zinc ABC transporter substrate-binding protein [Terrimicrobiaceae bacterium]|nr:zinc ABC transporter substrate-binding protein [Terrimicrobiaceae bacterium]